MLYILYEISVARRETDLCEGIHSYIIHCTDADVCACSSPKVRLCTCIQSPSGMHVRAVLCCVPSEREASGFRCRRCIGGRG